MLNPLRSLSKLGVFYRIQINYQTKWTISNSFKVEINKSIASSPQIPNLIVKPEKDIMANWWSIRPFQIKGKMMVPIFRFKDAQYSGQALQLPQSIFNVPLRRDILHRLYNYRIKLDKFRTKATRTRGTTSGSNRKMRPQKGQGKARMGSKRAPHLRKGGKAHGSKPKVYSFPLNAKIKLNAIKILLTAKLFEGKIRIIDSEHVEQEKTKILSAILKKHELDKRALFYIITGETPNKNYSMASSNINQLKTCTSYSFDVLWMFKADRILITVDGLHSLLQNINKTSEILYGHPSLIKPEQPPKETIDIDKPYQFKFKILAEYLQLYKKLKQEHPQLHQQVSKQVYQIK